MKKHFCLLLAAVISIVLGCSKSDPENPEPEVPKQETITIAGGADAVPVLGTSGGSASVTFTASTAWNASVINTRASDWCSVSPTSGGAGAATITITAKENVTPDNRAASITITAGNATRTIKVEQKQKDALTVSQSSFEVPAEGKEIKVVAKSNVSFTHTISEDAKAWIKIIGTKALKDSTLTFEIAKNDNIDKRSGEIYLASGNLKDTVKVHQAGETPSIVISKDEYVLKSEGETFEVEVASNVNASMNLVFPDGVEPWMAENTTRAMSTNKYVFTAQANEAYDSRSAMIIFANVENNVSDTVRVTQTQKDAIVVAKSSYNVENSGGTIEIEVGHNIDYEYSISGEWISKVDTKAMATDKLQFAVAENTSYDNREGSITFTANGGALTQVVKVYQSEKGALIISKKDYVINDAGGEITMEIQSNVEFSVTSPSVDWLHEIGTKGLQTHTLKYQVDANEGHDSRSTQIYVRNQKTGTQDTLTVTQTQKDAIVVAKSEYEFGKEGGNLDFEILTNVDITVTIPDSCASWISQVETRALETKKLYFNIAACETLKADRAGHIIISGGNATQTIKVTQSGVDEILEAERQALIEFYKATNGDNWVNNTNWCSDKPVGEWYGVSVDGQGRVSTLGLSMNNLSGSIPECIGDLVKIQDLVLYQNFLTGNIPESIGNLEDLRFLDLSWNKLTGSLPGCLSKFNLWRCYLHDNKLSGKIPESYKNWDMWNYQWMWFVKGNQFNFEDIEVYGPKETVTCVNGKVINLEEEIKKNKYTILYRWDAGDLHDLDVYVLPQLRYIHEHYSSKKINIISWTEKDFYGYTKEMALEFINSQGMSWDTFVYGDDGNVYKLPYDICVCVVDSTSRVVYSREWDEQRLSTEPDRLIKALIADFKLDDNDSEEELYESTDYSSDGKVRVLQEATIGSGIDVVLMGDGYSDRLIADGTYDRTMELAYNKFFEKEPYKSFKDYFNVYITYVVSKNEVFTPGSSTALDCDVSKTSSLIHGRYENVIYYANLAVESNKLNNTTIVVAINERVDAGTCFINTPTASGRDWGEGMSISYVPIGENDENFGRVLQHEACGHGFAKLADEYVYAAYGNIPEEVKNRAIMEQTSYGWWKNIDFTGDPAQVRWRKFLQDSRYANEGLGVFEGAYTYPTGVWRSSGENIMIHNTGEFNAPSREAIYYRIHKLAYGPNWEYDYEKFVEYDAKNRRSEAQSQSRPFVLKPQVHFAPLNTPIVVNYSLDEIKKDR